MGDEIRRRALQLYLEGMGFRAIGRVLGVSNVAVLKWIRAFGEEVERMRRPGPPPKIAMIDEMWHFVHAKKRMLAVDIDVLSHKMHPRRSCGRTKRRRPEELSQIISPSPGAHHLHRRSRRLRGRAAERRISPARCTRNGSKASTPTSSSSRPIPPQNTMHHQMSAHGHLSALLFMQAHNKKLFG
ncbi:MAG: hypothetical protein R3D03_16930 [Geminicoccaceae bacterium]